MSDNRKEKRAEIARANGAKSRGPATAEGKRRSREARLKHGLYAKSVDCTLLPFESEALIAELRTHFHAFWEPRGLYESRKVEQLVRLHAELDRLDHARRVKTDETLRDLMRKHPELRTNEALAAEAEFRASCPGGVFERFDLRTRRLNIEISRLERDLLRLGLQPRASGSTDIPLQTKDGDFGSTDLSTRPYLVPTHEPELPEPVEPAILQSVTDWAKSNFGFEADPHQTEILEDRSGRMLVCAARQTGKSTAAAIKAVHEAATNPNSLILLAGPTNRQSSQIMEKARSCARKLYDKLGPAPKDCEGFSLPNGSQIVAVPGSADTIRGFSNPRLIVVDEAAFVNDDLFTDALVPMQATGNGALLLLSTPGGQSGFFYDKWHNSETEWTRVKLTAEDCPRISKDWLENTRKEIGDDEFRQEFLCEFLQDPACPISRELAESCLYDDIEPLFEEGEEL